MCEKYSVFCSMCHTLWRMRQTGETTLWTRLYKMPRGLFWGQRVYLSRYQILELDVFWNNVSVDLHVIIDRLIRIDITTFEGYFCFIACGGNCLMCDDSSKCTTCRNSFYLDGGECQRKLFRFNIFWVF